MTAKFFSFIAASALMISTSPLLAQVTASQAQTYSSKDVVNVASHRTARVVEPGLEENDDVPAFAPEDDYAQDNQWRVERDEAWRRGADQDQWSAEQDAQAPQHYRQEAAYQQDENAAGWVQSDAGGNPLARQEVTYNSKERAGTLIIDTPAKRLYYVLGNGQAIRYGIGVGKPGFEWAGVKTVTRKEEWPDWRPPEEMIRRRPDLPRFMPGGPSNPLGARAMYLGSSLYRIHGSNEPESIGKAVSSGCIRMMNADVIDLFNRVKVGTKVVVR